jgi:hypothetical protein
MVCAYAQSLGYLGLDRDQGHRTESCCVCEIRRWIGMKPGLVEGRLRAPELGSIWSGTSSMPPSNTDVNLVQRDLPMRRRLLGTELERSSLILVLPS